MTTRRFTIPATSAADGSGTFYSPYLSGKLESIQYVKTNFTDGVDFTITADATGETLWTESNVNAAVIKYPRAAIHTTVGVAALYAAGGVAVLDKIALSRDRVKIVIAAAGNATTGSFTVTISD